VDPRGEREERGKKKEKREEDGSELVSGPGGGKANAHTRGKEKRGGGPLSKKSCFRGEERGKVPALVQKGKR